MTESLAEALPKQIERVSAKRDRWIKMASEHPEMGPGMSLTIAIMKAEIDGAVRAAASGDVVEMMAAHQSLADYSDDD
jgi:hypothetical protein